MTDSISVKAMRMLEEKLDVGNRAKLSDAEFVEATMRYLVVTEAFKSYVGVPKLQEVLGSLLEERGGLAPA